MASKNALIREFQLEMRAKDEEYVKSLQRQRDEIEDLVARMTEQFTELRSSYEVELESIEDSFLAVCVCRES
jgi:dynein regulatory complex protein 1